MVAIGKSSGTEIALISYVATSVTGVICLIVAGRLISPGLTKAMRRVPKFRKYPSISIFDTAGPALAISMATPVAMQTDRLFLSHMSELRQPDLRARAPGDCRSRADAVAVLR